MRLRFKWLDLRIQHWLVGETSRQSHRVAGKQIAISSLCRVASSCRRLRPNRANTNPKLHPLDFQTRHLADLKNQNQERACPFACRKCVHKLTANFQPGY